MDLLHSTTQSIREAVLSDMTNGLKTQINSQEFIEQIRSKLKPLIQSDARAELTSAIQERFSGHRSKELVDMMKNDLVAGLREPANSQTKFLLRSMADEMKKPLTVIMKQEIRAEVKELAKKDLVEELKGQVLEDIVGSKGEIVENVTKGVQKAFESEIVKMSGRPKVLEKLSEALEEKVKGSMMSGLFVEMGDVIKPNLHDEITSIVTQKLDEMKAELVETLTGTVSPPRATSSRPNSSQHLGKKRDRSVSHTSNESRDLVSGAVSNPIGRADEYGTPRSSKRAAAKEARRSINDLYQRLGSFEAFIQDHC